MPCPGSPEQNGIIERKHRYIVETEITMLLHAKIPEKHQVHSFLLVVCLINRLPSNVHNIDLWYFRLHGEQPDYSSVKVFGFNAFFTCELFLGISLCQSHIHVYLLATVLSTRVPLSLSSYQSGVHLKACGLLWNYFSFCRYLFFFCQNLFQLLWYLSIILVHILHSFGWSY